MRRSSSWLILLIVLLIAPPLAAHHGWGWAVDELSETTGTISAVSLGNPHGEITLDVDEESWQIEVGQPWRNERAGLDAETLEEGRTVTVIGHRSAQEGERKIKAVRLIIDGHKHDLYPDRVPDA